MAQLGACRCIWYPDSLTSAVANKERITLIDLVIRDVANEIQLAAKGLSAPDSIDGEGSRGVTAIHPSQAVYLASHGRYIYMIGHMQTFPITALQWQSDGSKLLAYMDNNLVHAVLFDFAI